MVYSQDEETFVFPVAWRKLALPRRGGMSGTAQAIMAWAPGEPREWAARKAPYVADLWKLDTSVETAVERYRAERLRAHHEVTLMTTGPGELIELLLAGWRPERVWDAAEWLPPAVAAYGLTTLQVTTYLARRLPASRTGFSCCT